MTGSSPPPRPLRIVSYNLHKLADDTTALRTVISALRPDVLVAQEGSPRLRWRPAGAKLARECGLVHVAGGRDAAGTLILTTLRVDVTASFVERFPVPRFVQARGAVGVAIQVAGLRLAVLGSHFDLDEQRRLVHTRRLLTAAESFAGTAGMPFVIAADTNELPGAACWQLMSESGLVDAASLDGTPTFPASRPRARIDAVLVPPSVRVVGYAVGAAALPADVDPDLLARASDHLPVVVDLLPRQPAEARAVA
jgi:endonuclease/exonuclease/phosphatase family metal-dependent hydrolase